MSEYSNRRGSLVVNKPVQSRIVFAFSWPSALCILFTGMLLALYSVRLGYEAMLSEAHLPSLVPVVVTAIGFMVLGTGFLLFNALKFSHRIAGPSYRMQQTLSAFRNGHRHVRARLRKGDHLNELADTMNEFLDWVTKNMPAHEDCVATDSTPQQTTTDTTPKQPAELHT